MADDQIKRFERWQKRLPENTAYLVSLVLKEIVPIFEARGLKRYSDYAGYSSYAVGPNCIPLQRRSGTEWPTVELLFDKRCRPSLGVNFSMLPEQCRRHTSNGTVDITRIEATVVEGKTFFMLCKGSTGLFNRFGYHFWTLNAQKKLRKEVDTLRSLLPHMFKVFDEGVPENWLAKRVGFVDRHIFVNPGAASQV
jgi:hypothetical protein